MPCYITVGRPTPRGDVENNDIQCRHACPVSMLFGKSQSKMVVVENSLIELSRSHAEIVSTAPLDWLVPCLTPASQSKKRGPDFGNLT